jgi:predicted nucleic acid-binding protein
VTRLTILVDTSILIDHLRGNESARSALIEASKQGRKLMISVVTRTEILGGMRPGEQSGTLRLLDAIDCIEVDRTIADRAGELARAYRSSHPRVDVVDYILAATAQLANAELWTRNVKHFPMFDRLAAPY